MGELDRISFSVGQKINMGNYESRDLHFSYSSDVKPDETLEQAKQRIEKTVVSWIKEALGKYSPKKTT